MEFDGFDRFSVDLQPEFWILHCSFAFYILIFNFAFLPEAKKRPPIIGRVCAFDAKIYKNVDGIFDVSACEA
jgi:hypothetical protein